MRRIDLNADLGELEDASLDAAVMPLISSANIACGGHSGDEASIRRTIRLAMQHGVAVGAHPSYPDRENFGRQSMPLDADELCSAVREQVGRFQAIAREEGAPVRHVKLHGALYNDLADDYDRAYPLCRVLARLDPGLRIIGFSNSAFLRAAEDAGLVAVHEVFADRTYDDRARLVPRRIPGAVICDVVRSLAQVEMMVLQQRVPTVGDRLLPIRADSVCVHGDNPAAVDFVKVLGDFFRRQGIGLHPGGDLTFAFSPLGETGLLARLPPRIARSTHRRIRALHHAALREKIAGLLECVPCYAELKMDFDPGLIGYSALQERIGRLCVELEDIMLPESRRIEIPVCYEAPYAPDLEEVARHAGLETGEVIRRHCAPDYLVYMLGFSPGFGYLGGLDPVLATPRKSTPRVSIPAGSVGIASMQTGIYPVESSGGWQIIGRTPVRLFEPDSPKPFLLEPGDEVRFIPIPEREFSTS